MTKNKLLALFSILPIVSFATEIAVQPVTEYIDGKMDYNTQLLLPSPSACVNLIKRELSFIHGENFKAYKGDSEFEVLETFISVKSNSTSPEQIYNIYRNVLGMCLAGLSRTNYDINTDFAYARSSSKEKHPISDKRKIQIFNNSVKMADTGNFKTCLYHKDNVMTVKSFLVSEPNQ